MIKSNELRIGNWIDWDSKPFLITLNAFGTQWNQGDGRDLFNEFKPIPLTPEVLEKCGFIAHAIGYYHLGEFYISYSNIGLHEYQFRDYPVRFKYLHQLQNLYFILTGTELTCTP